MNQNQRRRGSRAGFTLVELLISIALMVMLLAAVTMIFGGTTETVAVQEARMEVFTNARYALDIMENDLLGVLSFDPIQGQKPRGISDPPPPAVPPPGQQQGLQRFWMENGFAGSAGQVPQKIGGHHSIQAGDSMGFRTTTTVGYSMATCEVTYLLIPGDHAMGPNGQIVMGDSTHAQTARTQRPLFTLIRQVRVPSDPAAPAAAPTPVDPKVPWKYIPQIKDPVSGAMVPVIDQEVCHYVTSFNLEYYAINQQFSQLDPSPFPQSNPAGQEPAGTIVSYRIPAIRVTLCVVEDVGERQERTIQKEIWIPAS
ncbi:MAG TPA: prepilin-type N-terminal cleavage/methylation domain-containing protein [Planctomycetota bacterium]|nr:prepilin-type N-terminal cleavage/methylation domain-containing protein [Planctomycetota bacterium]